MADELDLSDGRLGSVAAPHARLWDIRRLYLDRNELEALPEWLEELPDLVELSIRTNRLTSLAALLWKLPHLTRLSVGEPDRLTV